MTDEREDSNLTKVVFRLEQDADGFPPADWEHLWAVRLPDGNYELDNTPFFATGVSYLDILATTQIEGLNVFQRVVRSSGHCTLRVVLFDRSLMDNLRSALREMGCATELSHLPNLVAVDVPPDADLGLILAHLQSGEKEGLWEYEEGAMCR